MNTDDVVVTIMDYVDILNMVPISPCSWIFEVGTLVRSNQNGCLGIILSINDRARTARVAWVDP